MLRIRILHKLPTPYNDFLFKTLSDKCDVDLQVYHLWRGSWRRPWKTELGTGYPNRYLRLFLGIDFLLLKEAWADKEGFYIIGDWAHLISILVIIGRILLKFPVAIWTDTPKEDFPRPLLKKFLRAKFLAYLLKNSDVIFGTGSPAIRVLQSMGAPIQKLVKLPCYVDFNLSENKTDIQKEVEEFRKICGCRPGSIVITMIGTLTIGIKGQDLGIKAFFECKKKVSHDIEMLIAGEGPDRKKIEKLILDYGLAEDIKMLGWLEPGQLDLVYRTTDIIVHPSRYDSYPVIILEGMSYGKPVVGSDVCGSVEDRIVDGVNGYSFPSENVDVLTSKLVELIENGSKREEIGRAALQTARNHPVDEGVRIIIETANKILIK